MVGTTGSYARIQALQLTGAKTMQTHTAWRFFPNGSIWYVEWIGNGQQKGDRYSYTSKQENAKIMTELQCRNFCSYMKQCGTVGFWS